ncbi:MAG TPA: signal peptidase I [Mycobacteriales bacterium]|nr:signal peptidase I [Mycobacteriales bacterium]
MTDPHVPAAPADEPTYESTRVDEPQPAAATTRAEPVDPEARRRAEERAARRSFWRELPILVIVAVGLALLIKTFLLQAFYIPSGSMENTLKISDRVLVNKVVYDFRDPHRGEIVVFNGKKAGNNWPNVRTDTEVTPSSGISRVLRDIQSFIGLGSPNDHDFIKRVIAVGGDTIECPPVSAADPNDCDGVVVNGVKLDESSYTYGTDSDGNTAIKTPHPTHAFNKTVVPKGELFVMGDHRDDSNDSRFNGTVKVSSVVGRAFVTVWPLSRFGGHGVPKDFSGHIPAGTGALKPSIAELAMTSGATPPAAGLLGALPIVGLNRRRRHRKLAKARARKASAAA